MRCPYVSARARRRAIRVSVAVIPCAAILAFAAGCTGKSTGQEAPPRRPVPEGTLGPVQSTPTPPGGPSPNGGSRGSRGPGGNGTVTPSPGTTPAGDPGAPGVTPAAWPTAEPTFALTEPPSTERYDIPDPAPRVSGKPPAVRADRGLVGRFLLTCNGARVKDRIARIANRQPSYTSDERTVMALFSASGAFTCRSSADRIQNQAWVDLSGQGLTAPAFLGMATSAKTLLLKGNSLVDLGPVGTLVQLRSLSLSKNATSNLEPLANLRWLESLAISEMPLSPGSLAVLGQHGRLTRLSVKGVRLARVDVETIGSLRGLVDLDLSGSTFEAASDAAMLAGLDDLRSLSVARTNVTSLAFSARFEKLKELDATGSRIARLPGSARWRSLQTLSVADTDVTEVADWAQTSKLPGLRTLILKGTKVKDLSALSKYGRILYLNYEDTPAAQSERCPFDNWDACER